MNILLGNQIDGEITTIEKVLKSNEPIDNVIIEGFIFDIEVRGPFRNGSYLYKGAVWDKTNSMYFQFFSPLEISLKNNMFLKLSGNTEKNQYTRGEFVLSVANAIEIETPKVVREDTAEKKRVELSVSCNYSHHISALSGEDLVKAAKSMGHTAVAVTDKGSVQGFPETYRAAKDADMKLILGMKVQTVDDTLPIVINPDNRPIYTANYTVFDVETTGFSVVDDHLIEIGATRFENGVPVAQFQRFIKSPKPVPEHITALTSITQEEIDEQGIPLEKAIMEFHDFWQDSVLVAHNAQFDYDHLRMNYKRIGKDVPHMIVLDTLQLSRMINTDIKAHGLDKLSKKYKVTLDSHHRADQDAQATGEVMYHMFEQLKEMGFTTLQEINEKLMNENYFKTFFSGDATILVLNKVGLFNLYKIISLSHDNYLGRTPVIPLRVLNEYREGLLIGSGSHEGRFFEMALNKMPEQVEESAKFFDYLEVEPTDTSEHLWKTQTRAADKDSIERAWKTIVEIGKKLNKMIVATGHVHYIEKEDRLAQHILMYNEMAGRAHKSRRGKMNDSHGYLHFRTTEEMFEGLTYLTEEEKSIFVVENTNKISDMCEEIAPLPKETFVPDVPDANDRLRDESLARAQELYGNPLPEYVQKRLDKEVNAIVGNGFAVNYTISADLVNKSNTDGYIVGSRGSVGSSIAATMMGITEVNPLKPHYNCPSCKWSLFFDHEEIQSGYDLPTDFKKLFNKEKFSEEARRYFFETFLNEFGPEKTKIIVSTLEVDTCPSCGHKHLIRDGQDIPFETFLGFNGDKVPDIDLNFSGEYQSKAHAFVGQNKEEFGLSEVFRAGTIGTVAAKTAYGYTKKYIEEHQLALEDEINVLTQEMKNTDDKTVQEKMFYKKKELEEQKSKLNWSNAEVSRIASRIVGAKRTTGQHAGGIIVVPRGMSINEFGGYQYPANDTTAPYPTTHYAFEHIHDNLLKLDILGHDDPTMLRLLRDSTGIEPTSVPSNDEKVLKLFTEPEEALGISLANIEASTGTLGVPEFGTDFVQGMVEETKPSSFAELVKISGLSHGTDVWLNNAQDLVKSGEVPFKEVIGCRDDIMVYLMQKGLEPGLAFTIMEFVRKGKAANPSNADKWEEFASEMRVKDVPEWYIESCKKIKYMFPKAHAAAYVLSAMRIAYFKVYYPIHYYATILSVRWEDADITEVLKSSSQIRSRIVELKNEMDLKQKQGKTTQKENEIINYLKVVQEAKERGIKFGNVRIHGSHSKRWTIDGDTIVPPFVSVPGLGETAAEQMYAASKEDIFRGVDDLRTRGGVNKTTVDILRSLGCLELIETKQFTFF